jgi:hypothetical protein
MNKEKEIFTTLVNIVILSSTQLKINFTKSTSPNKTMTNNRKTNEKMIDFLMESYLNLINIYRGATGAVLAAADSYYKYRQIIAPRK